MFFFFSVNDIKSTLNKQVQRADIRLKSLNDMLELLKISDQLIPSIKFYLLSGWQGMVQHDQVDIQPAPQVLDQVYIIILFSRKIFETINFLKLFLFFSLGTFDTSKISSPSIASQILYVRMDGNRNVTFSQNGRMSNSRKNTQRSTNERKSQS